jgi:hypothetical protein
MTRARHVKTQSNPNQNKSSNENHTHPYMCGYIHAYMHVPTNIKPRVCIRIYIGSRKQHEVTCTPSDTCTHKTKAETETSKTSNTWFTWKVNHPNHLSKTPNTKSMKNRSRENPNTTTKAQIHVIHGYEHINHIFIWKQLGQTLTTCILSLYESPMRKSKGANHRKHLKSIDW